MNKCYILGATAKGNEIFLVYKKALENKLEILGTPIETSNFKGTNKERFKRALEKVTNADIIIADMSNASTGAGIELGISFLQSKKIYVFANTNAKISSLVYGLTHNIFQYNNEDELYKLLTTINYDKD